MEKEVKEYVCKYCGKIFEKRHQLIGHYSKCCLNPNRKTSTDIFKCQFCGKECKGKQGLSQHENHCAFNPHKVEYKWHTVTSELECPITCVYCGKECKNLNSLRNHERLCKNNPNKQESGLITYMKRKDYVVWNKGLNAQIDSRVERYRLNYLKTAYRLFDEGRPIFGTRIGKRGLYKGIQCDSGWELAFVIYCVDNNIDIKRCKKYFTYFTNDGIEHRYYPDFIINDSTIVEIKGYYDKLSQIKHEQTIVEVLLLRKEQLQVVFDYVQSKYNVQINDIECLYEELL